MSSRSITILNDYIMFVTKVEGLTTLAYIIMFINFWLYNDSLYLFAMYV